jgi:hypothetical protein
MSDFEQCEDCLETFIWAKLPDECVHTEREPHPYGSTTAYETIVIGWTCPSCGHRTNF